VIIDRDHRRRMLRMNSAGAIAGTGDCR
jgi:hypothetical protein